MLADIALPPSPSFGDNAGRPVPATVVIIPVLAVTILTRCALPSEMYKFPDASTATLLGSVTADPATLVI